MDVRVYNAGFWLGYNLGLFRKGRSRDLTNPYKNPEWAEYKGWKAATGAG